MKVILTADVKSQGKKGDIINVSDGYARNYLFKNNLAVEANASNVNSVNIKKAADEHRKKEEKAAAPALAEKVNKTAVTVAIKTGENGRLYGSLGGADIAEALASDGIEIDKRKIVLTSPIKSLGTYKVTVKPYAEVSAVLTVNVVAR